MGRGRRSRALARRGTAVHPQPAAYALPAALAAIPVRPIFADRFCRPTLVQTAVLEAKAGEKVSLLVRQHHGTFDPLETGLRIIIAERHRSFVISFGGIFILRAASPA